MKKIEKKKSKLSCGHLTANTQHTNKIDYVKLHKVLRNNRHWTTQQQKWMTFAYSRTKLENPISLKRNLRNRPISIRKYEANKKEEIIHPRKRTLNINVSRNCVAQTKRCDRESLPINLPKQFAFEYRIKWPSINSTGRSESVNREPSKYINSIEGNNILSNMNKNHFNQKSEIELSSMEKKLWMKPNRIKLTENCFCVCLLLWLNQSWCCNNFAHGVSPQIRNTIYRIYMYQFA